MQKNSLSLCMIVRNEEETVGRAIKSALAVVDEVVVVDTGSSDNTRLIVEGYGARVVDFPWAEDFAAARNAGLAAAYGDWILVLDGDEVLESIRPVDMARLLANEDALAYYVRIQDPSEGGEAFVQDRVRLFRNHPDVRYRYPVLEQITPAIAAIARCERGEILPSDLRIVHRPAAEARRREQRARNQRLLQRAVLQYPDEPYFRYQLARVSFVQIDEQILPVKGFGELIEHLRTATQQIESATDEPMVGAPWVTDLYACYASALLSLERPELAREVCECAQQRFDDAARLGFEHSRALLELAASGKAGDGSQTVACRESAVRTLEALRERKGALATTRISDRYFSLYPLRQLGRAAILAGDLRGARLLFREALEIDPDYTGALCGLAQIAQKEGRAREALQIYLRIMSMQSNAVDAWIGGSEVLLELGFVDNARSWLRRLIRSFPEHPGARRIVHGLERPVSVLAGKIG